MAISIRLGSVNEIKASRRITGGIYGPPKAGKTHDALELCPGRVIMPILNDPNSLQTCIKVAESWKNDGYEREIVFMLDDKGAPIQVHIDVSTRIINSSKTCREYYKAQYEEVLIPLTEFACKQADGVVTDNGSDMMDVIEWARWGTDPIPLNERNQRKQLLMNYFSLFRSADVHSMMVLKEQDIWKTSVNDMGKTKIEVVGSKPEMPAATGYLFTDIFQLRRPAKHEIEVERDRIKPAIDLFNYRHKLSGVKFRPVKTGSIILSLVESQANNAFNATNTAWLVDPAGNQKPDGEFYLDAPTLENVWGLIYPQEPLDYWYQPVERRAQK